MRGRDLFLVSLSLPNIILKVLMCQSVLGPRGEAGEGWGIRQFNSPPLGQNLMSDSPPWANISDGGASGSRSLAHNSLVFAFKLPYVQSGGNLQHPSFVKIGPMTWSNNAHELNL